MRKNQKVIAPQVSESETIVKLVTDELENYKGTYKWSIPPSENTTLKNGIVDVYDILGTGKKIAVGYTVPEKYQFLPASNT